MDLGVAQLPEQEVGKPHFRRRYESADRDRETRCIEMLGKHLRINLIDGELARLHVTEEGFHSIDDFQTTAVAEGKNDGEAGILRSLGNGLLQLALTGSG